MMIFNMVVQIVPWGGFRKYMCVCESLWDIERIIYSLEKNVTKGFDIVEFVLEYKVC